MNSGKRSWTKKACWKAEVQRGRQSAEGCHQIVWKDATKLFNMQKCSAAARNRSDLRKKIGRPWPGHGPKGQRKKKFYFCITKIRKLLNVDNSNSHLSTIP